MRKRQASERVTEAEEAVKSNLVDEAIIGFASAQAVKTVDIRGRDSTADDFREWSLLKNVKFDLLKSSGNDPNKRMSQTA